MRAGVKPDTFWWGVVISNGGVLTRAGCVSFFCLESVLESHGVDIILILGNPFSDHVTMKG